MPPRRVCGPTGDAERPAVYRAKLWDEAKRRSPEGCPIKGQVAGTSRVYVLPWAADYERVRVQKARRKSLPIRSRIRAAGPAPMSVLTRIANSSVEELIIDQPPFALEQVANVGVEEVAGLLEG